jgi:hypothetical protein
VTIRRGRVLVLTDNFISMCKEAGLEFKGYRIGNHAPDLLFAHDPITGTTLSVYGANLSLGYLLKFRDASRAKFLQAKRYKEVLIGKINFPILL